MHTHFLTNLQILIIDDEEVICTTLSDFICNHGGQPQTADCIYKAITAVERAQFDVIICDIYLNGEGSGLDLLDQIQAIDPDSSVVFITGYDIEDLIHKVMVKDVYSIVQKPVDYRSFGLLLVQAARNTKQKRQNKHYATRLQSQLLSSRVERDKIFINTLSSLSNALEHRDEHTRNHSEIVSSISNKIAWEFTDNAQLIDDVTVAGKLHDLGKIGIRDSILLKKGSLTNGEYNIIKMHPEMSYKIIRPVDAIGKISSYVLHHHEHYDGSGYPHKLTEKGIPAGSRIIAVADAFNALTSNRPYRKAIDKEKALQKLFDESKTQFDPEIVEILYKLVKSNRVVISLI